MDVPTSNAIRESVISLSIAGTVTAFLYFVIVVWWSGIVMLGIRKKS